MADFDLGLQAQFKFQELFNQLGWDKPPGQQPLRVDIGDHTYTLDVVAHKRGVQIFHCSPDAQRIVPEYAARQKIDRKVTPDAREHLIIFTDTAKTTQVWQWVARAPGRPSQYREVRWRKGESAELLRQKLNAIAFTIEDEELLLVTDVTRKLAGGFDRDKVTKKFYTEFDAQRLAFTDFIAGIPHVVKNMAEDQRWYAAVLIDRLMFLWFLQEKLFLNGNKHYLRERLQAHLQSASSTSFYRAFLCPLFFRGFAEQRTAANRAAIETEFGQVPYLNGGLFAQHELERRYGDALDVEDAAFSKLFNFFDKWDWHLDDRPLGSGKEINPDVLGYIFEKFVNAKENAKGAYYTKEDITDYIGKNTIIPCLLSKVRTEHPRAFDELAWSLLKESGDTYIYPAMLKGVDVAYPAEIANGLDVDAPDLLERRKPWNKRAENGVSLPTEIWRETIVRHQRTREIRAKIAAGELREIGDLITNNLDIRLFAQQLIERCTDVAMLKSFWFALAGRLPQKSNEKYRHGLSVLDPTCGSGAFLLAALNILKPLYDATLRAMHAIRNDVLIAGTKSHPETWKEIDAILARFATDRPDRAHDYAVTKHIIVHNLYGVDIEEQATEIAKLRLFLKLIALLEPGDDIEPLPDVDFNIRHGNTLIGYATEDETERAVKGATQGNLFSDAWEDIRIRLTRVKLEYENFQIQQTQQDGHVSIDDKRALESTLSELEETLNYHLAKEYGIDPNKTVKFDQWKASHQPFHWYVDFYPLMVGGGFDVVIGNPPYVEYSKVRDHYSVMTYLMPFASNLYGAVCQRSCMLAQAKGHIAQIVPVSLPSTDRMEALRKALTTRHSVHFISFGTRPGKLFEGAEQRLTIFIQSPFEQERKLFSGGYRKWNHAERVILFETLDYISVKPFIHRKWIWPKLRGEAEKTVMQKLQRHPSLVSSGALSGTSKLFYKNTGLRYFNTVTRRPPNCKINGIPASSSRETVLLTDAIHKEQIHCLLLSSTFYSHHQWTSNGRDLNPADIELMPMPLQMGKNFASLSAEVEKDYEEKAKTIVMNNKKTGLVELQSLSPSRSKFILDKIDVELATQFGLRPDELDLLINMDIKYRLGQGGGDDDDD